MSATGSTPTHLHQIPLNLDAWCHISAGLSACEEGALFRAVRVAWCAQLRNAPPATLPADPAALQRIVGDGDCEIVRRFFVPVPGSPHLLAWQWLTDLWQTAVGKYERRAAAGRKSGAARRAKPKAVKHLNNARTMNEQPKRSTSYFFKGGAAARGEAAAAPLKLVPEAVPRADPPEAQAADQWVKDQGPACIARIESEVDRSMRAEMSIVHKRVDPEGPLYAGVRAARIREVSLRLYRESRAAPPPLESLTVPFTSSVGELWQ